MSSFSAYYDHLLPELPGCTNALLNVHVLRVARDFCRKTGIWRQELDAVNLVAGQAAYTLATPSNSALVRVVRLTAADKLLWLHGEDDNDEYPDYARDKPPFSLSNDLTQITLIADETPTASSALGLKTTATLQPANTATVLPDFLLSQYLEAIKAGTLSGLMKMMKKPWSNPGLSAQYQSEWSTLTNRAGYEAQVGNTGKLLRVKKWG